MSLLDMMIIGSAAFIGWWLVSWFFDARKPKPQQPQELQATQSSAEPAAIPASPRPSLLELSDRWHMILGVREEASAAEIEAAYRAALEACDREVLTNASAASRRQQIEAAYEFIRKVRKDAQ
jgi:hypothetical protein